MASKGRGRGGRGGGALLALPPGLSVATTYLPVCCFPLSARGAATIDGLSWLCFGRSVFSPFFPSFSSSLSFQDIVPNNTKYGFFFPFFSQLFVAYNLCRASSKFSFLSSFLALQQLLAFAANQSGFHGIFFNPLTSRPQSPHQRQHIAQLRRLLTQDRL